MKLLSVREVAEALSISPSLVYQLKDERKLRYLRIGKGTIRFRLEDVEEYLSNCTVEVRLEVRKAAVPHLKHLKVN